MKFPPVACPPRFDLPTITFSTDKIVTNLLKTNPTLYKRHENDPTDVNTDVQHHAKLWLQALANGAKGNPTGDKIRELLEAEHVVMMANVDTAISKWVGSLSSKSPPKALRYDNLLTSILAHPDKTTWTTGFVQHLDHTIVTHPAFFNLPSTHWHDYIHGRSTGLKLKWGVEAFKRKWLQEAAELKGPDDLPAHEDFVPPPPAQFERNLLAVAKFIGGSTVAEVLDSSSKTSALRAYVSSNYLGSRSTIQYRLDLALSLKTPTGVLDEYGATLFDPEGGIDVGGVMDRFLPAGDGGGYKDESGGDGSLRVAGYLEGNEFDHQQPPKALTEYFVNMRNEEEYGVDYHSITANDIEMECIDDGDMEDCEVRWFAVNKEALVALVDGSVGDEGEAGEMAVALAEDLERFEKEEEESAEKIETTREEKNAFKKWITYHNKLAEMEAEKTHDALTAQARAQGVRSTNAVIREKQRIAFAKGGLNPDGTVTEEILAKRAARKALPWREALAEKKRNKGAKGGQAGPVEPDFLTEETKVFGRQVSKMLMEEPHLTASEEDDATYADVANNSEWDGVVLDEVDMVRSFGGEGDDVREARERATEEYRVAENLAADKRRNGGPTEEEEYRTLLRNAPTVPVPKEKMRVIDD